MRFIDYNGSGGIDPQDIATSVAVETATSEEDPDRKAGPKDPKAAESGVGCATLVACIALLPLLALAVMR